MEISGLGASDPFAAAGFGDSVLGKDAFMELLVTQLKHQDPLEPAAEHRDDRAAGRVLVARADDRDERQPGRPRRAPAVERADVATDELERADRPVGEVRPTRTPRQRNPGADVDSVKISGGPRRAEHRRQETCRSCNVLEVSQDPSQTEAPKPRHHHTSARHHHGQLTLHRALGPQDPRELDLRHRQQPGERQHDRASSPSRADLLGPVQHRRCASPRCRPEPSSAAATRCRSASACSSPTSAATSAQGALATTGRTFDLALNGQRSLHD